MLGQIILYTTSPILIYNGIMKDGDLVYHPDKGVYRLTNAIYGTPIGTRKVLPHPIDFNEYIIVGEDNLDTPIDVDITWIYNDIIVDHEPLVYNNIRINRFNNNLKMITYKIIKKELDIPVKIGMLTEFGIVDDIKDELAFIGELGYTRNIKPIIMMLENVYASKFKLLDCNLELQEILLDKFNNGVMIIDGDDIDIITEFDYKTDLKDGTSIIETAIPKRKRRLPNVNTNNDVISYRVGKKKNIAILDNNGNEVVIFPVGKEAAAKEYCDFLNSGVLYNKSDVVNLLHRVVNDSHCMPNRITVANSNNCAEFVDKWITTNLNKANKDVI